MECSAHTGAINVKARPQKYLTDERQEHSLYPLTLARPWCTVTALDLCGHEIIAPDMMVNIIQFSRKPDLLY